MAKKTTLTERLWLVMDWYIKEYHSNKAHFEDICDMSKGFMNKRKRDMKTEKESSVIKVARALPEINRDWLAYGDGPMLKKDMPTMTDGNTAIAAIPTGSPYYNVDFLGGFDLVANDQTTKPDGYINMEPYNGDSFLWCNITGESMSPLIRSGSKICLKKLSGVESIVYGEVYALVIGTEDMMRTVKWVTRADDESKIRLVPENKDIKYGSYQDVKKSDVIAVFKVMTSCTML